MTGVQTCALPISEPLINQQGGLAGGLSDRIVVQLPGVEDPARVKKIMSAQAKLEWKELTYPPNGPSSGPFAAPSTPEALAAMFGGTLPPDTEAYEQPLGVVGADNQETKRYYPLKKVSAVSGNDLREAQARQEAFRGWVVDFELTPAAGRRFGEFTAQRVGKIAAIVLDGKVISAPKINSAIHSNGLIEGALARSRSGLPLAAGAMKRHAGCARSR